MSEERHIPTVFDIAREAGVSRGTVDRVLHNRGRFSEKTAARIKDAVRRLGYSANPNAALLASRKSYLLACLLPSYHEGEYWELMAKGIGCGIDECKGYNLEARMFLYDQTDIADFRRQCDSILDGEKPSAVLMNVVFREDVIAFAGKLEEAGIPFAFIDNKVDGLGNFLYVGIDPYRSGELGAFLLTLPGTPEEIGLVRLLRDKGHRGDPNEPRRKGFCDYISAHFPDCKVHTVFIDPARPVNIRETLEGFLSAHPGISRIAMTNSRIHLLSDTLHAHPELTAVGFNDLEKNLKALKDGSVDFLVTHGIEAQAKLTIHLIADYLVKGIDPQPREHFIHLDILHRLNFD